MNFLIEVYYILNLNDKRNGMINVNDLCILKYYTLVSIDQFRNQ